MALAAARASEPFGLGLEHRQARGRVELDEKPSLAVADQVGGIDAAATDRAIALDVERLAGDLADAPGERVPGGHAGASRASRRCKGLARGKWARRNCIWSARTLRPIRKMYSAWVGAKGTASSSMPASSGERPAL